VRPLRFVLRHRAGMRPRWVLRLGLIARRRRCSRAPTEPGPRDLLEGADRMRDCDAVGADLTEREVDYLCVKSGRQTADDVLWHRSKLGLRFSAARTSALDDFTRRNAAAPSLQSEWRRAG
jgi:glycerol-3-phosphate dehydrogenase